jgi:hypothetical protein
MLAKFAGNMFAKAPADRDSDWTFLGQAKVVRKYIIHLGPSQSKQVQSLSQASSRVILWAISRAILWANSPAISRANFWTMSRANSPM